MALFEKKKTTVDQKEVLPFGLILMTGLFLLSIAFSISYGNKDYMKDLMTAVDWEHNILLRTSFLTGGLGLLLILDYGVRYSFNKENKAVPWIGLGISIAEALFALANVIIYFAAYLDPKEGTEWILRIVTATYILLLFVINVVSRVPKVLDFASAIKGDEHITFYLSEIALLGIGGLMMLLTVASKNSMSSSMFLIIFAIALNAIIGISPFFVGKFISEKKQAISYAILVSFVLTVISFAAIFIFHSFFKQLQDNIEYREFYWAAFIFGYNALIWAISGAYYTYNYKLSQL